MVVSMFYSFEKEGTRFTTSPPRNYQNVSLNFYCMENLATPKLFARHKKFLPHQTFKNAKSRDNPTFILRIFFSCSVKF